MSAPVVDIEAAMRLARKVKRTGASKNPTMRALAEAVLAMGAALRHAQPFAWAHAGYDLLRDFNLTDSARGDV